MVLNFARAYLFPWSLLVGECLPRTLQWHKIYTVERGEILSQYNTPKRANVIKSYLTDEEKSLFDQRYLEADMNTQADFIRKSVLQKTFRINRIEKKEIPLEEFKEILRLLGNLSGNINQIAHRMNENNYVSYQELQTNINELNELKTLIRKEIEKSYGNP
jgi:hypothetical protein